MYVRLIDGVASYYTITDLRRDNPDTSFPIFPSDDALASFNVYPCQSVEQPSIEWNQKLELREPTLINGIWAQNWAIINLTEEEVLVKRRSETPQIISMRQARLMLLKLGLLPQVDTIIDGMPVEEREAARIEWEYSTEIRREAPLVLALGTAMSLSEEQIDDLFKSANSL